MNWRTCGLDFMAWHEQSRGGGRVARHLDSSSIFYLGATRTKLLWPLGGSPRANAKRPKDNSKAK